MSTPRRNTSNEYTHHMFYVELEKIIPEFGIAKYSS